MPRVPFRTPLAMRTRDGYEALGGWRFGNTINGARRLIFSCLPLKPISPKFPTS